MQSKNNAIIKIVESAFGLCWILNAALFIPQIMLLYQKKNSSEISLLMFCCFNLIQIITIIHGYIKKDYLLIFGFVLSLIASGIVTILMIVYRLHQ